MSTSTDTIPCIEDKVLKQYQELKRLYKENPNQTITVNCALEDTVVTLTPSALKLALHFLNGFKKDKKGQEVVLKSDYSISEQFQTDTQRYKEVQVYFEKKCFWTEEYRAVLLYFFGSTRAPYVEAAWHQVPHLTYQKGYYRRAFRAPNSIEMYQLNQLNLIVSLNGELLHPISMKESIQRDWERYSYGASDTSLLWAAAIDKGNDEVYNTLLDIIYQRQDKGKVTATIVKSLLLTEKEEAWKGVEALLLSAQRQEGLRQTIVECVDEGSIGAFKHFIALILEHNLLRFSSVVRALDVWVGLEWEAAKKSTVKRCMKLGEHYLNHPDEIATTVTGSKDNAAIYMALWAQGVVDVETCIPLVNALYEKGNVEKRSLALHFWAHADYYSPTVDIEEKALKDSSPKIFAWGIRAARRHSSVFQQKSKEKREQLFDYLASQVEKVPKDEKYYQGFAFEWMGISISRDDVFSVLITLVDFEKEEEVQKLYPFLSDVQAYTRQRIVEKILPAFKRYSDYSEEDKKKPLALWKRQFALNHLKDRSSAIQQLTLTALSYANLSDEEIQHMEVLLQRKAAGLRRKVLEVLVQQKEQQIKTTVNRLLVSKSIEQRLAGLDILQQVQEKEAFKEWVVAQIVTYQERPKHSKRESILLESLTTQKGEERYTWENGLGLYDPTIRTESSKPAASTSVYLNAVKESKYGFTQPWENIQSAMTELINLFNAHANYSYEIVDWNGAKQSIIFGEDFSPFRLATKENPLEEPALYNYPLSEVWLNWYKEHKLTPRDLSLMEFYGCAYYHYDEDEEIELAAIAQQLKPYLPNFFADELPYVQRRTRQRILKLLTEIYPYQDKVSFLEGLVCALINSLDEEQLIWVKEEEYYGSKYYYTWRDVRQFQQSNNQYSYLSSKMSDDDFKAYWAIQYWVNEGRPYGERGGLSIEDDTRAYTLGLLTKDELYNRLLKDDSIRQLTYLDTGKEKDKPNLLVQYPFLESMVSQCVNRILEIEIQRGDSSTVVSHLATEIQALYGIDYFVCLLEGLGKENLHRGDSWGESSKNKKQLFSTLLSRLYPKSEDAAVFKEKIKAANITEKRLIEAALYAPQWLDLVAGYLGWKGLTSAAWWLQAHTKSYSNEDATTKIPHYSKVNLAAFEQGAVDIQWFRTAYKTLGKARWKILYDAAKYLSTGGQHKRAQLFADVILGTTKITAVTKRIKSSRNQDYLRAYGLVPLSRKTPEKDLLKRYQFIQKFKKESKQFGSQKQSSEAIAVKIALENLARTAGYDDPLRLTWAMESKTVQQILATTPPIELDETTITLYIDVYGKAQLKVEKSGNVLANIPSKYRKDKAVQTMRQQVKVLREQLRRTRASLEQAMVNGDSFRQSELNDLLEHPVVAPLVQQLVFESDGKLGFLYSDGLLDTAGNKHAIGAEARLAHCYDLYASGEWSAFQQYCFEQKIKQPFKQIFRTLYLLTPDEIAERVCSRRYAGHQVQPKKTVALLKTRGWTVDYYEGLQKVLHKEQLVVQLYAAADWFSPADVESPTLETIEVRHLQTQKVQPLDTLNPRLFSELMRDIDLVVSVAHVGGVDPEASLSTIEMRGVLVQETARLFRLPNVTISKRHAHIEGEMGDYTVHLGSGVCHQLPGNYLSILAVPSQHRGRIFLPFVDDDPRTAEVLSKVLMLAKDSKIQDPTILRQLNQKIIKPS